MINNNMAKKVVIFVLIASLALLTNIGALAEDLGFEDWRQDAQKGKAYEGQPGEGHTLGFANINEGSGFFTKVRESIVQQAKLAGFEEEDIYIMNNDYNSSTALKNANIMLSKDPDAFIEYQADAKVNAIVGSKFDKAGIPVIAVDVPVPNAPFMGVDNWKVANIAGDFAAKKIRQNWGGWDAVDLVVLLQNPTGGKVTMLRSEGFANALQEQFGQEKAESKIVRTDGGVGEASQAQEAMANVLSANPDAEKIVVTALNDQMMQGVFSALEMAGRYSNEDIIAVAQGADSLGQRLVREGKIDGDVAYFPEKYGEYIIPAVCAMIEGKDVPTHIYVENEVITEENIDEFYPKE